MNKVLLISSPLYFSDGMPQSLDVSAPPLGLIFLGSYIKKYSDKFDVEILDVSLEKMSLSEIGKKIEKEKYFAIGMSGMTPQLQGVVELARKIKSVDREVKIFLGGPHISADPDFINRYSDVFDYALTGEAERTLLDSLNKLLEGVEIPRLQRGEALEDLDDLSSDSLGMIDRDKYRATETMFYSRGCPFQCYFCSRPSIERHVRYRSVDHVLTEIKKNLNRSKGRIDFQDDTFTMRRDKIVDFCRAVIQEKLKLNWTCNTRIDLVDEKLLELMSLAGCSMINFGIESGSERVRQEVVNKGKFSNEQIKLVFSWCKRNRIKVACYFMIGHPTETREELNRTKQMILDLPIDILGLSIPTPFPGSKLYQIAEEEGIISKKIIDDFAEKKLGLGYAGVYPIYVSSNMTREYVLNEMAEINKRFYLRPKVLISRFMEDVSSFSRLRVGFVNLLNILKSGIPTRKPYKK
jgi:anaerobic magnesium-protoporphyrin IX monomethyl ester cyclase